VKFIKTKNQQAFTIVELIIVIVVIAILATLSIVSYNGIKKSAVDSTVKDSVSQVRNRMLVEGVKNGESYPTTFPSDIHLGSNVGLALTVVGTDKEFCINGTTPDYNDVYYHATQTEAVATGLCPGEVLAPSIIGSYNSNAGTVSYTFSRTATGDGALGLTVHVGEAWDAVGISWTAQTGAQNYEVQSRNPTGSGDASYFYYRSVTDGSSQCYSSASYCGSAWSGMIPSSTTSLTWTNTTNAVPASTGQTFEYRVRYKLPDNSFSAWDTAQLSFPIHADTDVPAIANVKVIPATDYSNVVISWDQVPNFSPKMNQVYYELQARNPSGSNDASYFWYRNVTDGSSQCYNSGSYCGAGWSGAIPYTTTSRTWTNTTNAVPASAGQNFEYKMRIRVTGEQTYYSPWSTVVVASYPVQSNSDLPVMPSFTVTPAGDWSNVVIAWGQVANFAPKMGQVYYELSARNPSGSGDASYFWYRNVTDGSSQCYNSGSYCGASWSGAIPYTTTSRTWTSTTNAVPATVGQTFEYEMRIRVTGEQTYYSPWVTKSLIH